MQKRAQEIVEEAAEKLGAATFLYRASGMGSARAAVESMCGYFAVALARHGITVNAVSPGPSDENVGPRLYSK